MSALPADLDELPDDPGEFGEDGLVRGESSRAVEADCPAGARGGPGRKVFRTGC